MGSQNREVWYPVGGIAPVIQPHTTKSRTLAGSLPYIQILEASAKMETILWSYEAFNIRGLIQIIQSGGLLQGWSGANTHQYSKSQREINVNSLLCGWKSRRRQDNKAIDDRDPHILQSCTNYMAKQAAKQSRNINLQIRVYVIKECGRTDCHIAIQVEIVWDTNRWANWHVLRQRGSV